MGKDLETTIPVSLRIPVEQVETIDELAAEEDRDRSNMIRRLVTEAINARAKGRKRG